ncbi:Lrp/AsnC family transcriptional regulator [Spongiactinospora sp. TRM90649]|uniref:Lrp/AsnC family transcriptional regulator n=1 Tax=Spongiactinospora sp. TRM90649 TaxID=3031114 RepID=UPI0023F6F150|nr:Lrp/AsnC family transcriptional regulator [Spongiactinospora sp. TRM90649]MDF5755347.1 Lrp/AsnC family transcriptional regulator [Spongiactinospora sp. TRM90649]
MNDLDTLDRKILVALHLNGRASWTDIAQAIGTSTTTVARRAQQLIQDGVVVVSAIPHVEHRGPVDAYLVRLACSPGTQLRVADRLARLPEIRSVTVVTGGHDIVFELVAPRNRDLFSLLVDEVQRIPGALSSQADLVLHTYQVSQEWSLRGIDLALGALAPRPVEHGCGPQHLDEVDHEILTVMRADGRASFQSVAKHLGVSESTVRRRFEVMTERGCAAIVTYVPAAALGYGTEVLFWMAAEPGRLDAVAKALAAHPEVRRISAVLGQASLAVEVIMRDTSDLHRFTGHALAEIPGVRTWTANVQLVTVKRDFLRVPAARTHLTAFPVLPAAREPG